MKSMIELFVPMLVGAFITWLVSWIYYKKAGDELKKEASRLHCTADIILRWLEAKEHSEIRNVSTIRDEDGVPIGLDRSVFLSDSVSATDSVENNGTIKTNNSDR